VANAKHRKLAYITARAHKLLLPSFPAVWISDPISYMVPTFWQLVNIY